MKEENFEKYNSTHWSSIFLKGYSTKEKQYLRRAEYVKFIKHKI